MKTSRGSKFDAQTGTAQPLSVLNDEASLNALRGHTGLLSRAWGWIQARQVARSSTRRLRVAETVSLGDKRFVAVVQVDGRHFLLAGGPTNIVLLAQLDPKEPFEKVLKQTLTVPRKQPAKRKQAAKRAGKENVAEPAPTNVPWRAPFHVPENFADVLQKSSAAAGSQPAKPARKQNHPSTLGQTGHYA